MKPSHIGKYEIQRRLGTGGMGSLYLARDPGLERFVAIKVLKDEFEDDREIRERFTREARSVARLRHRNIIVVYEIGEHERRPFMAMEYIAGETLTEFLRRVPTPPLGKRLSLIEDLCDGLAHAHATGIIHRDVKPANIMLDAEGVLKILDFGIARLGNSGMTQDGMMMGTVNYMSPEQIVGRGVDHRTDIFATGAVLYEAIALTQAFPGRIDTGVLHCILNEGPLPLAQHVPDVDPELAGIVEHALERDPERRYQDLRDLQKDLVRVRRRIDAGQQSRTMPSRLRTDDSPVERRGLDPERGAKLRRQQVEENLRFGEEAFARGDHDAALHHAERAAAMVDPDNPAPADLIDKARFAIEAKVVRHLLTEAEQLLAEGHPEDAAALVKRASSTLPDLHGATELRNEIRLVSEKVAAAREREQRISVSLERARTSMERGGFETALRAVYEVLAIDPERPEARELEQEAKSRLEAQREHERARRSAYDRLKSARALADAGRFDEAAEAIRAVTPPSETVRIAAADALAAVREQQRQAAHAAIVAEARVAFERGELEQALAIVDSIPAEEQSNEARGLRATIDGEIKRRRELEQKRQALEDALASGQSLLEAGELARAFERVEDAAKLGLADERIPAMRHRIAELGIAAQERRRQEARDRTAAKMVDSARRLLANGDGYAAIALLERAGSDHELVVTALHEIRAAVAEQEERVRQEAERRRREEDARLRAEREAARQAEEERKAAERQRLEAERRRQEEEARQRAEREAARQLEEERRAAERQRQEAEHRRQEEEARHRAELEAARQAEEERAAARQLEEERKAAERQRQEIERRRQEEEARYRAEREAARQLEEERKAAERQRQEEQRRREAEHRRQLEEAEARELDAQAATLVAQARGLFGSGQLEDAVTLLRGAPAHTLTRETLEELDSRRIASERQRARESRQRARQQRRAAARATLHHAAADRRVHLAGVAILVAAVAGTVWQLWPASPLNDGPSSSTTVAGVPPIPVPPTGGDPGAPQPQTTPPAGAIPGGAPSSGAPASGAPLSGSTPGAAPASAAPPVPIVPPAGGRRTEPPAIAPPAGRSGGAASPVAVPPTAGPTGNPPSVTPPPSEGPQLLPPPVAVPPPAPNPTPAEPPVAVQPNPPPVKPDVPPPVSNVEQDRAAIDQLLNEYIAAYSRMDETRVRALDPTFQRIQGRELMKSVTLVLPQRSITVSPDGQSAVLTATGSYNYVWNRAGFPPSNPARLTWNLRKQGTTWTVVR